MPERKEGHFHTGILNGCWIANKSYPSYSKDTDKLKNSHVNCRKPHLQHWTSEAAVQKAPTVYSQIYSSPEENE